MFIVSTTNSWKIIKPIIILITSLLFLLLNGCQKEEFSAGMGVEFYLVENYQLTESGAIDESTVVTQSKPSIYYSDILSYNSQKYTFEVSTKITNALGATKDIDKSIIGKPFALKVNGEIIYTGFFWSWFYSSFPIGIAAFTMYDTNDMRMELFDIDKNIPDNRNDERILSVLRKDGKLIE